MGYIYEGPIKRFQPALHQFTLIGAEGESDPIEQRAEVGHHADREVAPPIAAEVEITGRTTVALTIRPSTIWSVSMKFGVFVALRTL